MRRVPETLYGRSDESEAIEGDGGFGECAVLLLGAWLVLVAVDRDLGGGKVMVGRPVREDWDLVGRNVRFGRPEREEGPEGLGS